MSIKKVSFTILLIVVFLAIRVSFNSSDIKFDFLAVGQGDSILITLPTEYQILIDGGPDNTVLEQLRLAMDIGDNEIDLVILSHGDADHLAGLVDVLDNYQVQKVMIPKFKKETFLYRAFLDRIALKHIELIQISRPQVFQLDEMLLEVISPTEELLSQNVSANNASIVVKALTGEVSFLFTGDIEKEVEEYLIKSSSSKLAGTVLKVPHHGSRSSSSKPFLEAIDPKLAIIQVGVDNKFGHPHQGVIYRYDSLGIPILRTDQLGMIELATDGATIWREYSRWSVFPQLFGKRKEKVYTRAELN